jgi:dinuclear metal center YbgI/SA1388 family protein
VSVKLGKIIKEIETIAPKKIAEEWDNVGLQIGSSHQEIHRILLTLDITKDVIQEGVDKKVDLIIGHHPFIFKGLKTLTSDQQKGQLITQLIKNDIAVYVAHTNLDKAEKGLNDFLIKKIGLVTSQALDVSDSTDYYKVVVFTPIESSEKIIETFGKNGAGSIGNYDFCTFSTSGTGRFRPLKGANPYLGQMNEIETVKEVRIEGIIEKSKLKVLIKQLKINHPYEEMAYDVYPLENGRLINQNGLGKIGKLELPVSADNFIEMVKKNLDIEHLRGAGIKPKMVSKVAICSGAGADMIGIAKALKADVLITGDLKHHDGQRAIENNFWVLDAGHYGTEKWAMDCFSEIIRSKFNDHDLELIHSKALKDYIQHY